MSETRSAATRLKRDENPEVYDVVDSWYEAGNGLAAKHIKRAIIAYVKQNYSEGELRALDYDAQLKAFEAKLDSGIQQLRQELQNVRVIGQYAPSAHPHEAQPNAEYDPDVANFLDDLIG